MTNPETGQTTDEMREQGILREARYGAVELTVAADRTAMGRLAAARAIAAIRDRLARQDRVRLVFAAAPSQNDFLDFLSQATDIDWSRVEALHMDEYIGLAPDDPATFRSYLDRNVFSKLPIGTIHYINDGSDEDPLVRYARILAEAPIDIVLMGIGENGHIAFNDPPVADFNDPDAIKIVELDDACKQQQVNDGTFPTMDAVPPTAWTLTIPTLVKPALRICIVPTELKAPAIRAALEGPIETACPASILREAPVTAMYIDAPAASLLSDGSA